MSIALLLLTLGSALASDAAGWRMGALFVVGGALGLVLYHAAFGFTGAWRVFLTERRGAGLRAQFLMLALASAAFLPLLSQGAILGQPLYASVAPLGVSVVIGAFLFGAGMQLGGACASGTLFALGGGNARMLITLAFFLVGSLFGALHLPWWLQLPSLGRVSLLQELGLTGALAAQGGVLGLLALVSLRLERSADRRTRPPRRPMGIHCLWQGPWPLMVGAAALAALNVVTLLLSGQGWGVSFGYTLWAAKLATAAGIDVSSWTYWSWPYPASALQGSIFAETTSVMNLGLLVGALLAAGLAGRFGPLQPVPWRAAMAAVAGGLLMGYGARLAFGCNIGALFTGIASGSLHGWVWLVAAVAGNLLGLRLRSLFDGSVQAR